jgi:hypothetical protein
MLTKPITRKPTATSNPINSESTCITRHKPGCGFLSSRIPLLLHR